MPPSSIGPPPPPDEFHKRPLPLITVKLGRWCRVTLAAHSSIVFFGKAAQYRFDDPDQKYGVLYAGSDYTTSVAESLLRDAVRAGMGSCPVDLADIQARVIATLAPPDAALRLVDLTKATGIGLDNQISTTPDYALTQAWSRALHDHPEAPDGLYYVSRNRPRGKALALFDRVQRRVDVEEARASRAALRDHPQYAAFLRLLSNMDIPLR